MLDNALLAVIVLVAAPIASGCGSEAAPGAEQTGQPPTTEASAQSELPPGHPPIEPPTAGPETNAPRTGDMGLPAPPPGSGIGAAGLTWQAPDDWIDEPPRNAMRKAQYRVPGSAGDAECVVFYFGPGQGGDPRSNTERWAGQFTQPDGRSSLEALATEEIDVGGIPVLLAEVSGTYSGGRMGGPSLELADHMLLGAVVQGADANWFFKFTGPAETIREQRDAFMAMIRSVRRGSTAVT